MGQGFDVHRLVPGRKLILCGVEIPWKMGLLGHSDADVATHAICDAILGACALGDIGTHFPDTDERYAGINSLELLKQCIAMVQEKGYDINNVDCTIIAQEPKLAKHYAAMRESLAKTMEVELDYVSVKATTTEKMGFCGDGSGIAALAVAVLQHR